jgi:2-oxoisovalerate dehydrogenase E1 component
VALGGDGSVATNGFWSALTIATTLRLPLLFFIEDNRYGISVPASLQTPGANIAANLRSFSGLLVLSGSGTDPDQTAGLVREAVAHVRSGAGPALLRLEVPRLAGHTFIDNAAYKSAEERATEEQQDPLRGLTGLVGDAEMASLRVEAEREVRLALAEARARPFPSADSATRFLFSGEGSTPDAPTALPGSSPSRTETRHPATTSAVVAPPGEGARSPATGRRGSEPGGKPRVNLIDAVRSVLEEELASNPRAVVFGEDVGAKGGVHGATTGLQASFGAQRVFDTSLSEEGIIGRAVGMALAGLLPIPEIQFRKYADPATEQINDLGTLRWRTAGKFAAPVVVRIPVGHGKRTGDPWHSVTGEAVYAHTLGWRLAYPSNAADAAGLLRSALRGGDPTFFFEHRALLDTAVARRPYPGPGYTVPFGLAEAAMEGSDLTVVTWGAMVGPCVEAAGRFPGQVTVLDLRTISPWDRPGVLASVRRSGRCLVVHEDTWTAGFAGEILATVSQEAFADLDAPPRRLTTPDVPIPYSAELMRAVLPNADTIAEAMEDLLAF